MNTAAALIVGPAPAGSPSDRPELSVPPPEPTPALRQQRTEQLYNGLHLTLDREVEAEARRCRCEPYRLGEAESTRGGSSTAHLPPHGRPPRVVEGGGMTKQLRSSQHMSKLKIPPTQPGHWATSGIKIRTISFLLSFFQLQHNSSSSVRLCYDRQLHFHFYRYNNEPQHANSDSRGAGRLDARR